MRGVCSVRPLRPPALLLHNAALPSVAASHFAKAPLGAGHRFAPYQVKATGVMHSGLRWSRSLRASFWPVASAHSCCVFSRPHPKASTLPGICPGACALMGAPLISAKPVGKKNGAKATLNLHCSLWSCASHGGVGATKRDSISEFKTKSFYPSASPVIAKKNPLLFR